MSKTLTLIALSAIPLVEPGDDIVAMMIDAVSQADHVIETGDVLVIAQKIISKTENRYVYLDDVEPTAAAIELAAHCDKDPRLVETILSESAEVIKTRPGVVIVEHRLGYVHANAGIDRSNISSQEAAERVLLLPENPDASAGEIRDQIRQRCGCDVNIIINDSAGRAWRNGTVGFAIASAGFEPLVDMYGQKDLFDRPLEVTQVAVADELAAAASFLMGQSNEGVPAVLIKGAKLVDGSMGSRSLIRDKSEDLFRS